MAYTKSRSEVLRQAILDLTAENFKIIAPVHDALLIEIPKPDKHLINRAQTINDRGLNESCRWTNKSWC